MKDLRFATENEDLQYLANVTGKNIKIANHSSFDLSIDTNNAAFEDNENYEVSRILEKVAAEVAEGMDGGKVRDINGNTVGFYSFKG